MNIHRTHTANSVNFIFPEAALPRDRNSSESHRGLISMIMSQLRADFYISLKESTKAPRVPSYATRRSFAWKKLFRDPREVARLPIRASSSPSFNPGSEVVHAKLISTQICLHARTRRRNRTPLPRLTPRRLRHHRACSRQSVCGEEEGVERSAAG